MAGTSTLRELWDTTRMRLLVEIDRQGSVSAAASAIGIGQPSASQHLRLLEAAAGQQLVERTGRGSRLTEAGRLLAARAAQALSSVGAAAADDRIELEPFLEDEIVGVAKPGLAPLRKGTLAPARLTEFLLLAREPGSSSQRAVDNELRTIGIKPAGFWELGSSEAIKRAAREGLGVAFLSRYAVAEEVERGDLESFRLSGRPPLLRHFSVARLAGRPLSPSERSFIETLTSCCAKQADYAAACVAAGR